MTGWEHIGPSWGNTFLLVGGIMLVGMILIYKVLVKI